MPEEPGPQPLPDDVEAFPGIVGRRVRAARSSRGWTLDELAQHSGVSRRMIVNVESGTASASITTLLRLASALQVSLADLVAEPQDTGPVSVSSPAEREAVWQGAHGGSAVLVASTETPDMFELWDWRLGPGDEHLSDAHEPGTRELLHVVSGRLTLTVGDDARELRAGDAATISPQVPHSYANRGTRPVRFSLAVFDPLVRVRP